MPTDINTFERMLTTREIVVVCGPGGVGKTTVAAASGLMAAARTDSRVLVLTVDPARRLATALGLKTLGNKATKVPHKAFTEAGLEPRGELWAAMLDTKASWDDLVKAHAPDEEVKTAILDNPLYDNITSRFVQSHDYIAMERLHELHGTGKYDLIIVDTPPSRNAIDFLEAPGRMADFFSSRLLRWLTVPYRSRIISAASRPFYTVADRILGSEFLRDIADFFVLFQTMHEGFVERASAVERTLADKRTTFVVVSSLEASSVNEAEFFIDELTKRDLGLGAVVLNRILPDVFRARHATASANKMVKKSAAIAADIDLDDSDPDLVAAVLKGLGENYLNYREPATREAEMQAGLSVDAEFTATVPYFDKDVADLEGLVRMGKALIGQSRVS